MTYEQSLLVYRAQTINQQKIWKSKKRLIKDLTPILRNLKSTDFELIDNYSQQLFALNTELKNSVIGQELKAKASTEQTELDFILASITQLKLDYLAKRELLNAQLKNDKILHLETYARYLLLSYCTWSEASLIRLKHTPYGLNLAERWQSFGDNIEKKWENLIAAILDRIPDTYAGDKAQMRTELGSLGKEFIVKNSFLRNKIAHGQWDYALNRHNNDLNIEVSTDLDFLDPIKIDNAFEIHRAFTEILANIIDSNAPEKLVISRNDSYLFVKQQLDELISRRSTWDFKTRATFLQQRKFDTRNVELANVLRLNNVSEDIIYNITKVRR